VSNNVIASTSTAPVTAPVQNHKAAPLPALIRWDGKPGRRAETFLADVALYAAHYSQQAAKYLGLNLSTEVREPWERIREQWAKKNYEPTWEDCKVAFKQLVGETYERRA